MFCPHQPPLVDSPAGSFTKQWLQSVNSLIGCVKHSLPCVLKLRYMHVQAPVHACNNHLLGFLLWRLRIPLPALPLSLFVTQVDIVRTRFSLWWHADMLLSDVPNEHADSGWQGVQPWTASIPRKHSYSFHCHGHDARKQAGLDAAPF